MGLPHKSYESALPIVSFMTSDNLSGLPEVQAAYLSSPPFSSSPFSYWNTIRNI